MKRQQKVFTHCSSGRPLNYSPMTSEDNTWPTSDIQEMTVREQWGETSVMMDHEPDSVVQIRVEEEAAAKWLEEVTGSSPMEPVQPVRPEEIKREIVSLTQKLEPLPEAHSQDQGPGRKRRSKQSHQEQAGKMHTQSKLSGENLSGRIQLYSVRGEKFQDHKLRDPETWTEIATVRLGRAPNHLPFRLWSSSQMIDRVVASNLIGYSGIRSGKVSGSRMRALVCVYLHEDSLWAIIQAVDDSTFDMPVFACYLSAAGTYEVASPRHGILTGYETDKFSRGDVKTVKTQDENLDSSSHGLQQPRGESLIRNPSASAMPTREWLIQAIDGLINNKISSGQAPLAADPARWPALPPLTPLAFQPPLLPSSTLPTPSQLTHQFPQSPAPPAPFWPSFAGPTGPGQGHQQSQPHWGGPW